MAERALTEEAMLQGLHDIRLPGDAPGGLATELLAGAGVGILLALALGALLTRVTARRRVPAAARAADRPGAGTGGGDAARRALLARLKRERPARYAEIAPDIYRPDGLPEAAALGAMLEGR